MATYCFVGEGVRSYLGAGGVNADGVVQLVFGHATLHGYSIALGHLAGIGTKIVEPDHTVL